MLRADSACSIPVLLLAACHERLLRLPHLIAQTLQARRDLRFGAVAVRIDAAAKPVGRPLQARFEVGLVHALERLSQLAGRCALTGIELARGVSHVLLKVREVVGHALPIVGELLEVAPDRSVSRVRPLSFVDAIGLALFLGGQRSASFDIAPRRPVATCDCIPPSRLLASRRRSAARRASDAERGSEAARRISSCACRRRSSACCAACCEARPRASAEDWPCEPCEPLGALDAL